MLPFLLTAGQTDNPALDHSLSLPPLLVSLIELYIVTNKAVISADLIKSLLQQAALAAGLSRNTSQIKRQAARTAARRCNQPPLEMSGEVGFFFFFLPEMSLTA